MPGFLVGGRHSFQDEAFTAQISNLPRPYQHHRLRIIGIADVDEDDAAVLDRPRTIRRKAEGDFPAGEPLDMTVVRLAEIAFSCRTGVLSRLFVAGKPVQTCDEVGPLVQEVAVGIQSPH
ncbi:hypothetical protein ASG29_01795 [Sphingomonas sp. Leaf412]|nr:hypothetical protein ASG29_01795 [Sphingomonas sp. Leaf412]